MKQRIARKPRLFDAGGDLSKDWYIAYSFRHPYTHKFVRVREMKGLSKISQAKLSAMSEDDKEAERRRRYEIAPKLIEEIVKMIREGYNPFKNKPYIYTDEIVPLKRKSGEKTIEDYLREAEELCTHGRRPGTVKNYRNYLNNFITWLTISEMHLLPLSALEYGHAERFLASLVLQTGNSNKWRNEHLSYLRRCFKHLLRMYPKQIQSNPFEIATKIKHVRKKAPIYRTEMRQLVATKLPEFDPQLWLFVQFVFYTGLRPGIELRNLQLNMIHLGDGVIVLPAMLAKDGETRHVTIPEQLELQLRAMKLQQYPDDYYLFSIDRKPGPAPTGKNYFWKSWRVFREKFNIPEDYKLYAWKHTGATAADESGIDRRLIKDQLGHSSLQQTEEYLDSNKSKGSDTLRRKFPSI